ncbi:MAG TPA: class I SAM-dependent methyltransferase [Permianibacter sp.]|nr:class I SAM-dependent methyltransferase [Permianibacter sp.]
MGVTESLVVRTREAYEQMPYESHAVREAFPPRLQAIATLLGMTPAAVSTARVLEIGCSSGGNLLPLAVRYPQAQFVGIDLAEAQVAQGRALVEQVGISNLQLIAADIMAVDDSIGRFDYIIAHGVMSWVPPEVQAGILSVCRRLLQPQGVAYISYNTYPGWHFREMGRAVMARAAALIDDPTQRLQKAKDLMAVLAREGCAAVDRPVGPVLKAHLEHIQALPDYYLQHEYLEPVNQPFYFRNFVLQAMQHELAYLSDADMATDMPDFYAESVRESVRPFAHDRYAMAELLDYVAGRSFRRSLLVQGEIAPDLQVKPNRALMLHVASELHIVEGKEINDDSSWQLARIDQADSKLAVSTPLTKAVVKCLDEAFPATVDIPQLTLQVLGKLGVSLTSLDDKALQQHMQDVAAVAIRLFFINAVTLLSEPVLAGKPGEYPRVFAAARAVAATGATVVPSLNHRPAGLPPSWLPLILQMDGRHNRASLLALAEKLARKQALVVPTELAHASPTNWLQHILDYLHKRALLEA